MSESPTPESEVNGPWTLWLVWLLAMVLGGVLWWASFGGDSSYGPAHYQQHGCDSGSSDPLYVMAALVLAASGIALMVKAVRRRDWFYDIGLWAGLFLTLDGLLMFWYFALVSSTRGCD